MCVIQFHCEQKIFQLPFSHHKAKQFLIVIAERNFFRFYLFNTSFLFFSSWNKEKDFVYQRLQIKRDGVAE
jgi:hypothetical protein